MEVGLHLEEVDQGLRLEEVDQGLHQEVVEPGLLSDLKAVQLLREKEGAGRHLLPEKEEEDETIRGCLLTRRTGRHWLKGGID